jgi:hypothetical protein
VRGRHATGVLLLSAVALAGCYGSTEPATEIGETSATLNGTGTLDRAPALVNFEGGAIDGRRRSFSTPQVSLPKGASGRFAQRVAALDPATTYEYRLCAVEAGGGPVCAQPRRFRTTTPDGDRLTGRMIGGTTRADLVFADIQARSGPAGQNPSGSLHLSGAVEGPPLEFTGFVTCLAVASPTSFTVGAVGQSQGAAGTAVLRVSGTQTGYRLASGSAAPDCAGSVATPLPANTDDLFVFNAP